MLTAADRCKNHKKPKRKQGAGPIKLLWGTEENIVSVPLQGVPLINDFIAHLAPEYFMACNLPGLSPIAKRELKQGRSVRFVIFYVRFEMTQNVCGSKVLWFSLSSAFYQQQSSKMPKTNETAQLRQIFVRSLLMRN